MKLTNLVADPSKLKTHGRFISPGEAYEQVASGNKDPRLINIVTSDPHWAYQYALSVIKGRFPEGEPAIAKDPQWGHYYARNIIKGRWPEAELTIAKDPAWAYRYAIDVVKSRFPEGEPAIAKDPVWKQKYQQGVIRENRK